jgi:hypothetical protein
LQQRKTKTGTALRKIRRFGCGNFSVVGAVKGKPGTFGHKTLFCQSYRCDRCRKPKLRRVRARISEIAQEHKLTRMATLTLDPKRIPSSDKARTDRYIRECWRKMRVLLARQFNGSLSFVGVLEFQENGNAHLHGLIGQYIAHQWLSLAWQSIGGGKIVDIRYVDVHRVSAYLTVYLAGEKVAQTLELLPKRARIFTTSRSIVLWGKKKTRGWWLRKEELSALYDAVENPSNVKFEAVEDLKPFGLELLSYFESPPSFAAIGERDIFRVLRAAVKSWKEKRFSLEQSGEVSESQTTKGDMTDGNVQG